VDGEENDSPTTNGNEENHIPLHSSQSNPHLLDIDTTPQDETDLTIEKVAFYFLIMSQDIYIEHNFHESEMLTCLCIRP
jgi:hypothetical protein